jgi:hypothetical protein
MKNIKKIYIFLVAIIALVPLGLISENPAWGEWENSFYQEHLGFIPQGIKDAFSIDALMSDYSVNGLGDVTGYYLSAIVGVLVIFAVFYALKRFVKVER